MTPRYDVAIVGAGPVGMALSLMLSRLAPNPARIALFGQSANQVASGEQDPRTLALNEGSRESLRALAAWPDGTAVIRNIHVSQHGRLGRTCIRNTDFNVDALGHVAAYASLLDALQTRVNVSGIKRLPAVGAQSLRQSVGGSDGDDYPVTLGAQDDAPTSRLVILADGATGADLTRDYEQHAVLATARASQPLPEWAWERFRNEGPLAVLPHPAGEGLYSIVWCCKPTTAAQLQGESNEVFSKALTAAFGDRLGRLSSDSVRHVFPLALRARRQVVDGRIVAIGNAAQSLHPVAGQGLNLGLRDAEQLSHALSPWLAGLAAGASDTLDSRLTHYARSRRIDRLAIGTLTDLMPRIFATGLAPVEHACGAALLALDLSKTLRAPLARKLLYGVRS